MTTLKSRAYRYLSVGTHTTILMLAVVKTTLKRLYRKIRKQKIQHSHLKRFIEKRAATQCNLNTLFNTLNDHANQKLIISKLVDTQPTYTSKEQLLNHLPTPTDETEIIAIPIAVEVFSISRHFVTLIIDFRDEVIEFYDPIGYSSTQYNNTRIWGPKCKRSERLTLAELIAHTKSKYEFPDFIENQDMHQKDVNQCALFVYDRIYKRATKGLSFEKAGLSPLTSKQAFI